MNLNVVLIIIILLEIWGITAVKTKQLLGSMIYYTQLSNAAAMVSAFFLLVLGNRTWITGFRFLSVCMLVMTGLVTAFVLQPLLKNNRLLFWSRSGFFLHIVCPIVNVISYYCLEPHAEKAMVFLPPAVTLLYGGIMLYMNYIHKIDGPYPFLRIHKQSAKATVLWILVLLIVIGTISSVVMFTQ